MKKKKVGNQIYICYRYDSGLYMAKEIADFLKRKGYNPFMDDNSSTYLEIAKMIELCDDFILVLNEKALHACIEENDKIKHEILYAHKLNKNIILAQDQIKFLEYPVLPPELEFLQYLNWTPINPQLFNASMNVLTQRLRTVSNHRTLLKKAVWGTAGVILCGIVLAGYLFWPIPLKEITSEYDEIVLSVPEKWTDVTEQVDLSEVFGDDPLLVCIGNDCGIMVTEGEDSLKIISSMSPLELIEQVKTNILSKGGKYLKTNARTIYGEKMYTRKYIFNSYIYEAITLKGEFESDSYYDILFYYPEKMNILQQVRLSNNFDRIIESFKETDE